MGLADRNHLHIPYPAWAKDGELKDGQDFENWKELQRWADRFRTVPRPDPLIFHWPGQVDVHIDVRNAPGKFSNSGRQFTIEWIGDIAPVTGITVEWYFDNAVSPEWTHSIGTTIDDEPQIEQETFIYHAQHIAAVVTASDSTAAGLTAFVYLD